MAKLAYDAIGLWDALEADCGDALRLMSGLLNFGDPDYVAGPEGMLNYSSISTYLEGPPNNGP